MDATSKTAAATAAAAGLAKFLGRYLATKPAGIGFKLLMSPASLLGMKIGTDEAAVLGGGLAGLTVGQAVGRLFPDIKGNVLQAITAMTVLIAVEYAEAVRRGGQERGRRTEDGPPPSEGGDGAGAGRYRFAEILGRALCHPDQRISGPAANLLSILASNRLRPRQYDQLQACDTPAKFMALAQCADADELGRLLPALVHAQDRGVAASAGHGAEALASELAEAIGAAIAGIQAHFRNVRENDLATADQMSRRRYVREYAWDRGTSIGEVFDALGPGYLGFPSDRHITEEHIDAALAPDPATGVSKIDALRNLRKARRSRIEQKALASAAESRRRNRGSRIFTWVIFTVMFLASIAYYMVGGK